MKIAYNREKNMYANICWLVCILLALLSVWSIVSSGMTQEGLVQGFELLCTVVFVFFCGRWVAREAKAYRAERKRIVEEGHKCVGEVVEFVHRLNTDNDHRTLFLKVKYYSSLLDKEVAFETPALAVSIKEVGGTRCVVYEAEESTAYISKRKIKSFKAIKTKDFEGNLSWKVMEGQFTGVTAIVDSIGDT